MYPVSEAFLETVKQNTRNYYWTGKITTSAGAVYEFGPGDIVKGSGYITSQCCGSAEIELGTVYASEMGISLFSEIDRYTLEDAKVELFYHLRLSDGSFEEVPMDYLTGVMCAAADRKLSSEVGFKGICRKVLIFVLVGAGHLLDVQIFGETGVLRTAVIFFYISNEGLSLVENAAYLGLPVPERLRMVLEQLHDRAEKDDSGRDAAEDRKDGEE